MVIGSVARALNFLADKRQRDVMVCLTIAQYFSNATDIPVVVVIGLRFIQPPSIIWIPPNSVSFLAMTSQCGGAKKTWPP